MGSSRVYIATGNGIREVGIIAKESDYTTYRARNCAIVDEIPSSMTNGTIAFVY